MRPFRFLFAMALLLSGAGLHAQIGIGTATPDPSAMLDVKTTNKGVLLPRVALTGTADNTTIPNPATALLVYNTAKAGTDTEAVVPGFYYWDEGKWVNVLSGTSSLNTWSLTGNSGMDAAKNFIGTTDKTALRFRVNNQPAGVIDPVLTNTAFGLNALVENTEGGNNVALGFQTLMRNTTGYWNTGVGAYALMDNTEGKENTAGGFNTLVKNVSGNQNTAVGQGALFNNVSGNANTATGVNALVTNTLGNYNTAYGAGAINNNGQGSYNTAIGNNALFYNNDGSNNTAIGAFADVDGNRNNATAIGYNTKVGCDNCLVLGSEANVGIGTSLPANRLSVKGISSGFLASFENSDGEDGDGIQIKLGRTHPAYTGSGWINIGNPIAQLYAPPGIQIRNWVLNGQQFEWKQLLNLYPSALFFNTGFQIANVVIDQINANKPNISIPQIEIPDIPTKDAGIFKPVVNFINKTIPSIPAFSVPLPDLPRMPQIVPIEATKMVPNISFKNANGNSLSNKNQFISFKDIDNRELGSIRAESVNDWMNNYLDEEFFTKFTMSLVGLDFVSSIGWAGIYFTEMTSAYNSIGVEYASGHGDYAEWLERTNLEELITPGDIVGVRGGKITRNLLDAEQIRVVSTRPIMLGNAPEQGREAAGNKIAFMGQVPVKVMGPVASGDYIVALPELAGYGKAIHPQRLTTQDLKLAVGRAWESNTNPGAKLVNTLVGIDKADYVMVLESLENKIGSLEEKFAQLAAQVQPTRKKARR